MKNERIYLECDYSEKDECKSYGARWDKRIKKWYIIKDQDQSLFYKWLKGSHIPSKKVEKVYLDVDFKEHLVVKNMGAKWDKQKCQWYITQDHNKEDFKFWTQLNQVSNNFINGDRELDKLISKGKEKGYITYDELNSILSPEKFSSKKIEDIQEMIEDVGISLVDSDDDIEHSLEDKVMEIDENIINLSDHIISLYESVYQLHLNENIEEHHLVSNEETPRQEFARHLKTMMEDYDPVTWKQMFRLDPESYAFMEMSEENKKLLIN